MIAIFMVPCCPHRAHRLFSSGKTTLPTNILSNQKGVRSAVLVNEIRARLASTTNWW